MIRPRRVAVLLAVAAAALTLDIVSKVVVVAQLPDRPPIRLLGGLLTLRVTRNSGAAFSIGTGMTLVLTLIAVSVIIAILRTARRLRSLPWAITLGLLLGGATGNLVDRLLRSPGPLRGHVVDWIELPHWPVFNLADSAIVCGGLIAVLLAAKGLQLDGTRAPSEEADPGTGGTAGATGAPTAAETRADTAADRPADTRTDTAVDRPADTAAGRPDADPGGTARQDAPPPPDRKS
ncbi:signal peptidase II [Actinomadura scrupuli]|uniref:signal peptidase II n=1 Tax=Actinomadura scrupuli TaxID=559629 RepID=UPI003D96A7DC